jgi:hypothetical protein
MRLTRRAPELGERRETNAHPPTLLLRAAGYPRLPPFSILPRLAGQQARDRLGERTPEVVPQVIDSVPHARSYYSDAFGGAAFSFTRLLVGV